MKRLVILAGLPRGGEYTWNSIYSNLQEPLNADLAIATSKENVVNTTLYEKSKHKFFFNEYDDWFKYYEENFQGNWKEYFDKGHETGLTTSGYIHFAIKDIVKKNYLEILKKYDQIAYTRFDQFFIYPQAPLENNSIWISEGEDYGGVNDRIIFFPSKYSEEILGICDYINTKKGLDEIPNFPNCESVYLKHMEHLNLNNLIKRYKRNHFTVALKEDPTRWRIPIYNLYLIKKLMLKYPQEFLTAMENNIKTRGLLVSIKSFRFFMNYKYLTSRITFSKIIKKNRLEKRQNEK